MQPVKGMLLSAFYTVPQGGLYLIVLNGRTFLERVFARKKAAAKSSPPQAAMPAAKPFLFPHSSVYFSRSMRAHFSCENELYTGESF